MTGITPGPVPPKFDKPSYQSPLIGELLSSERKPHQESWSIVQPKGDALIVSRIIANSVGKRKLCYAVVGLDMRCQKCKKHFMTHDPLYINTLSSKDQVNRDFVSVVN